MTRGTRRKERSTSPQTDAKGAFPRIRPGGAQCSGRRRNTSARATSPRAGPSDDGTRRRERLPTPRNVSGSSSRNDGRQCGSRDQSVQRESDISPLRFSRNLRGISRLFRPSHLSRRPRPNARKSPTFGRIMSPLERSVPTPRWTLSGAASGPFRTTER